jgi:hypothetical protein
MDSKYKTIKTTCNKKEVLPVLQPPTAESIALITGVSTSYAKKVLTGDRDNKSETAKLVMYCKELIVDEQMHIVAMAKEVIDHLKGKNE